MKLADYLEKHGIKRIDFAALIKVSPGWITSLCDETGWPSFDLAERIERATDGAVTPNDFRRIAGGSQPPQSHRPAKKSERCAS